MVQFKYSLHANSDYENKPFANYNTYFTLNDSIQNLSGGLEIIKSSLSCITKILYISVKSNFIGVILTAIL